MKSRALLLIPLLAATLAGCGSPRLGGVGANRVVLTEADAGHHLTVQKGAIIEVQLKDKYGVPGVSTLWEASSSDSAVLSMTNSTHQVWSCLRCQVAYTADFSAVSDGNAQIQIAAHNTCEVMICNDRSPHRSISVTVSG